MAYGVEEKQYEERVGQLLQEFRMKNRLKWFPSHFSKGMKQKVMIMSAFLVEPSLYIVDEPFVGLDPLADPITPSNDGSNEKERCRYFNEYTYFSDGRTLL